MKSKSRLARYAAKLLFQFRVVIERDSGKRRLCEERIIVLQASSARSALVKAKSNGKQSEYSYNNDEGNKVYLEFIGILELLQLGVECQEDEVWYDIKEKVLPDERRDKLIPPDSKLNAIWNEDRSAKKKR
jgi:hypothetical protein